MDVCHLSTSIETMYNQLHKVTLCLLFHVSYKPHLAELVLIHMFISMAPTTEETVTISNSQTFTHQW